MDSDGDGYYEISNAGQLFWFSMHVDQGNTAANAILTRTIDLAPGYTFHADGSVTYGGETVTEGWYEGWHPPIGSELAPYTGTFDGCGFTIRGLYINSNNLSGGDRSLFGCVGEDGIVQNLGVVNAYINTRGCVGGVVSKNFGTVRNCYYEGTIRCNGFIGGVVGDNGGTVTNCYHAGNIIGTESHIGGVVGINNGTVTNCYNTGDISNSVSYDKRFIGGVVGQNTSGRVTNCYNTGIISHSISGSDSGVSIGGVVGYSFNGASVTNCYFDSTKYVGNAVGTNEGTVDTRTSGMPSSQFTSGEVCYLLNDDQTSIVFHQTCGSGVPAFTGDTVYYGYISCAASAEMVYTNNNGVAAEKPAHGNITYANKGSNHTWTCGICGDSGDIHYVAQTISAHLFFVGLVYALTSKLKYFQ